MAGSTITNKTILHPVILGQGGEKGPLTITSTGIISPTTYGAIGLDLPTGVANPTVINSGIIYGGVGNTNPTYDGGVGVYVAAGLTNAVIDNYNTVYGGAGNYGSPSYGQAGGVGVVLLAGTLNNFNDATGAGVIYGGAGGDNVSGAGGNGGDGVTAGAGAIVNNMGNVTGGAGGTGTTNGGDGADGVTVGAGGILNNSGYIYGGNGGTGTATGGTGGTGVSIVHGIVINNAGEIYGGGGGGSGAGYAGADGGAAVALNGGTLITSGYITGGVGDADGGTGGAGIVLDSGVVNNRGEILGGNGGAGGTLGGYGGAGVYLDGGTLITSGTIAGGNGGTGTIAGLSGDAILFGGAAGTLVVYGGAQFYGAVAAQSGVADLLDLAGAGPSYLGGIGTQFTNFGEIDIASGAWAIAGDAAGLASGEVINGFAQGDTLILSGFAAASDTYVTGTGLVLSDGNTRETLDLTGNFSTGSFIVSDNSAGGTDIVACFAAGTRIATARGDAAVEHLAIGDFVKTLHAGMQRIKFIGRRSYGAPFANHARVLPICIGAGAIAKGVPARDLHVSPGHAICLDGVLMHAEHLINGVSIRQAARVETITYFHIELENHEVIFAEGCPAETFMGEEFRNLFHNAGDFAARYPNEVAPKRACLPIIDRGFQLQAIWRRLAARAGAAQVAVPALGVLRGYIDASVSGCISGWAQDEAAPEAPVTLDVLRNGRLIARVLANAYRADLRAAGLGSGRHGFALAVPAEAGEIEVRRAADGSALAMTEACVAAAA